MPIVKRAKNSYSVVIELGRDPVTGKRRQLWRSVRGSKKDAQALEAQLLHQRDTGIDQPGKIAVGEFLERWLEDYAKPNTAPRTYERYRQLVRLHLIPALGALPLGKLRPAHIQAAYARVLAARSPQTVLHCHRVLKEALGHAVKWQLLARNPADAVDPPRPARYEIPAIGPDALRRLLAQDSPYAALIHLAASTGLRQGELLGLRWQDVDLERGVVHVRQSLQRVNGSLTFRTPKTHHSRRAVALGPSVVETLRRHRLQRLQEHLSLGHDLGLVFATPLGTPIDPSNFRRAWQRIVRSANVGHVRFHDLRHAHASLLLAQGVHPKIVSERLGHSSIGITLDTYSHVLPGLQAQVAAQFDALLGAL